jgi:excisionase family DNA binding protein
MNLEPARTPESPVLTPRRLCGETTNRLLTAEEVADCLGVTPRWAYNEARAGRLPHVRLGRYVKFRGEAIDDWLRKVERGTVA